jgi:type II secretory pathway pseudopilin PulG
MNIISLFSLRQKNHRGFTVLEFLIVLAIIIILIAILLPNLQKAREKSEDERMVGDLKQVALGLEQYKQICGEYPAKIEKSSSCINMDSSGTNLGNFIANIGSYKFNDGSSGYLYAPIAYNIYNPDECNGYHLGVKLTNEISGNVAVGDNVGEFDSTNLIGSVRCSGDTSGGFNGNNSKVFDIVQ